MTRWEDRNNTWYSYAYDQAGRCVFATGTGRALEYRYDYQPDQLRTTATNSLGHATTYQMNDAWQVTAETDPLGRTTRKTWDEYNRPLTVTDPLGRTTRY
ncbi:RHS repeat domain-containing protein, partial [Streptomyces otsuchiensis]|uniref:RHS repeat domain-containing protein n=1 Tax=Streptomyces otsuchiensis TaxID=2681388 RepID=UPI00130054AF